MNETPLPTPPPAALSSPEEVGRLRTMAAYDILDSPPEASFDLITALAARALRTPIATITFVDERRQWFKSAVGLTNSETPRELSFCVHALGSDAILVVPDATLDPRFADNRLVTGPPHIRFYAGVPLLAPTFPRVDAPSPLPRERTRLGTLCVIDTVPRPMGLRPHEEATLRDLGELVVHALLHRLAGELHREEAAGRQRAEAGWRQSEERYQRLACNALGVVYQFALAPDGTYSFPLVGEASREVLGLSPAAIRRDANAVFDLIAPSDRDRMRALMLQSKETLDPWTWEGEVRTSGDGTPRWLAATSRPQRMPDGTVVWDGFLTDVTARYAAETALREANRDLEARVAERTAALGAEMSERQLAAEQLRVRARQQAAVARLGRRALELGGKHGLDGLLTEATALVARILEVPFCAVIERNPETGAMHHRAVFGWPIESIGQPISNSGRDDSGSAYILREGGALTCPDLLAETRFTPSPEALRLGLRGAMCVIVARRTDGPAVGEAAFLGVLTVHDRRVREWSAEDTAFLQAIANVLAAGIDRRRAEEAVEAARLEAEGANAAKSEFLSRMSHELRTPLNAILGFGQLLELDVQTVAQRESVEHILRAGRHLLGLIDEVLDISRIESGRLGLETAPVFVRDVAEEAVALVRHAAKCCAVSLEMPGASGEDGHAAEELRVLADPMRLRQVLVNLLSNAVKYNVPGGRVGLRILRTEGDSAVRVEVWDTGRGIAAEHQNRLFLPFERLGAERDGAVEGTGIGLAIAKRLVEAMDGTIGVRSAAGEGSTFWVEMPAAPG